MDHPGVVQSTHQAKPSQLSIELGHTIPTPRITVVAQRQRPEKLTEGDRSLQIGMSETQTSPTQPVAL